MKKKYIYITGVRQVSSLFPAWGMGRTQCRSVFTLTEQSGESAHSLSLREKKTCYRRGRTSKHTWRKTDEPNLLQEKTTYGQGKEKHVGLKNMNSRQDGYGAPQGSHMGDGPDGRMTKWDNAKETKTPYKEPNQRKEDKGS